MTLMIRATLVVLVVAQTTLAAGPIVRGRSQAIGEAKEDEPCAPPSPATAADLALLRALQWAFEPAPLEVRVQAIEDLGLLGDRRALNPLAQLSLDANPALARAAVRAIGSLRSPRAEEILSNIVRHPSVPEATKLAALELVPFQNTFTALRFVHLVARQTSQPYAVLQSARALAAVLPQPTAEQAVPTQSAPAAPALPFPAAAPPATLSGGAQ